MFARAVMICLLAVFRLFVRVRYRGRDNLPDGGCIISGNHTSMIDPVFILMAFSRKTKLYIMAKAELMRVPVLGSILRLAGVFGVERGGSDLKAIKRSLEILRGGNKLIIFPTGTRFSDEARNGAAMLAMRAGVPILPAYITPGKKHPFSKVTVAFGEPVSFPKPEGKPTHDDYTRATDDLMRRIGGLADL